MQRLRIVKPPAEHAFNLRFITPDDALYQDELELRFRVLREPLGHSRADVAFPFERESLHLIAFDGSAVLGCVLFHPESARDGRLFQMAVDASTRGIGLGAHLVAALEAELRSRGFTHVHLHARVEVVPFYERLGYHARGERYFEVGIPHQDMARDL